jgi:hypothetical protein
VNEAGRRLDPERARQIGRAGGHAKAAAERARRGQSEPLGGTILELARALGVAQGPTWARWVAFLKVLFALPLEADDLAAFSRFTARDAAPTAPLAEAWAIAGRRAGKSSVAALVAAYLAACRDYRAVLRPGERGVVMCVAADRAQARVILGYVKALFAHPHLAPLVARRLRDAVELRTGVAVEVHTASYRSTRGYTAVGAVLDEVAFWPTDEGSAEPDAEVLAAIRPAMATVPGALLLAVSTPYAQRGELFKTYERHYGRADSDVLVWRAASREMNPNLSAAVVRRAYEDDAARAAAEWGAEFRRDVEAFLDGEAVRAVTVPGRRELPPAAGAAYIAFADPSGGSQDSFTLAIAHVAEGRAVLDLVRERRPPFSPDDVVREYAEVLAAYGLSRVTGDRYGGEWPRERFAVHGIRYEPAQHPKSDLYRALLPLVNASRVELLDLPRLAGQLAGLERRVARGGRDSVDHPPGGRDDLANAAAGALVLAAPGRAPLLAGFGGNFALDRDDETRVELADPELALDEAAVTELPGRAWFPGDPWLAVGGEVERGRFSGDPVPDLEPPTTPDADAEGRP